MILVLLFLSILSFDVFAQDSIKRTDVFVYNLYFNMSFVLSDEIAVAIGLVVVLLLNLIPLVVVLLLHRKHNAKEPTKKNLQEAKEMDECEPKTKNHTVKNKSPVKLKVKRMSNDHKDGQLPSEPSDFKFDGNEKNETGTVMLDAANPDSREKTDLQSPQRPKSIL
ncbi:hypothetical protein M3Y94_01092000 [Aphelenchoides besseyi]|nr:hypothetical protein M3Y94_01092000 [Aphelenchoides besseyi]KAI6221700.1 hypothetical protein M3Y95_00989800 [Aphelenchoides besseyi]